MRDQRCIAGVVLMVMSNEKPTWLLATQHFRERLTRVRKRAVHHDAANDEHVYRVANYATSDAGKLETPDVAVTLEPDHIRTVIAQPCARAYLNSGVAPGSKGRALHFFVSESPSLRGPR